MLILLSVVIVALNAFAEDDFGCYAEWQSFTNQGSPIEIWGDDYQPCLRYEWNLMFPDEWSYVEFDYTIDLNPIGAIDVVLIYMIDELGQEREILNYSNQPISEKITLPLHSSSARVVFISEYGNTGELYHGFKLSYRQGNSTLNDHVFYSNVGIGIQPQERLHVNGAIRGDGESGSLRIRTAAGTTEIGAADSIYSHFYTDRSAYFFNKPVYLSGGTLAAYGNNSLKFQTNDTNRMIINSDGDIEILGNIHLNGAINGADRYNQSTRIQSQYGYADIGAVNAGYFHFYTDRPGFYFGKTLTINGGKIRSASGNNLYLNTFDTTRVTILKKNGNVGIGVDDPQEKLHVNGAIRGDGVNGQVTLKGDSGYVTIGATSQAMEFVTNKSQFVFNKPIYNQSGIYNVRNSNLLFNINDTTRMTILQSSGNVGIGILNPTTRLHINDGALKIGLSTSASERLKNILQFGDGTYVQMGEWEKDDYLSFKASGYNFTKGNVGIGTLTPAYKLDVVGTIRAQELIVETTGADFVFAEDYQLRPLSEVKAFIIENKHLPEIKSAQEMQEDGVSVSELQTKLLQKIEELTLYLIQQEQTIQDLRQEVEQLKK